MTRLMVWTAALAVATFTPLAAQEQGGGGGGTTGGGGGTTGGNTGGSGGNTGGGGRGNTGGQQGRTQDPFGQQQQRMPEMQRPVFLSGKVVMDNGEVPPEPVTIVRVCNGQRYPESYSDRKGGFSFQLGGNPTVALTDASVGGFGGGPGSGFGNSGGGFGGGGVGGVSMGSDMSVDLTGCDLVAELPGFRSDTISLGRRRAMDNPDVGVIVLHSLGGPTSSVVSVTTLQAPKKAAAAYEKAVREMSKKSGKPEKAASELEKAVEEYPQFAAAWALLGDTRAKLQDQEGAREAYEKAVEADPEYLRPYPALVQMAVNANDWERTSELSNKMLSINPGITQVRFYQAVAELNMGRIDDARSAAMAIQSGPDAERFPKTHQIMGLIYSQQGSFSEAAKEYRTYLKADPNNSSAEQIKKQLNEWEVLGVIEPEETASLN